MPNLLTRHGFGLQDDLPATVRTTQERMMTMLQRDLKDRARQHREDKMQKKYRMVKFFGKCVSVYVCVFVCGCGCVSQ